MITVQETLSYLSTIHPSVYVLTAFVMFIYYFKRTIRQIIRGVREFGFSQILRFLQLQWVSKSINQLQLLFAKDMLKIPVNKDESEMTTYIEVKRKLEGDGIWGYMKTNENVRDDKIVTDGKRCYTMSSYNYLDFIRDTEVQDFAIEAAKKYATGNHGPRMIGGNTKMSQDLEKEIASFFHKENSLIMAGGYLCVMSVIEALTRPGDLIIADKLMHASGRAGFKLSNAKTILFNHNDFKDAEQKIKAWRMFGWRRGKIMMVIESVYSMDGDIANLPAARELCDKYGATLVCDEAHGMGTIGKTGRGLEEYYNMPGACDILVGTFSKSLSSVGGWVASDQKTIEFLQFFSQGNMFSAPLSAYHAAGALKCLQKLQANPELVSKVHENYKYLSNKLKNVKWSDHIEDKYKFIVGGEPDQPVIPLMFRDDCIRVLKLSRLLLDSGFWCSPVVAPACSVRFPRFRITVCVSYTKEMMDEFVDTLVRLSEEHTVG